MLRIRAEQMRALTDANIPSAIEAMMLKQFPLHCEKLGADGCRQTIREALSRGRALGFESLQLPAYVALEFAFGDDFSTNSDYPWAQEILRDLSLVSKQRMKRLRSKAISHLANLTVATATESEAPRG
jgi:hypothetical protein